MSSQVWWFVARSSGIVAWALVTMSVCWGLLLSTRLLSRRVSPAWLLDLHRYLGGLAVVFTGIHLVGLVADSYVTFGWAELFIPMASSWKPGAVAFGVVAFYLLLAIEIASLAMRRLPRSLWRWVHRSSFVLFGFATYARPSSLAPMLETPGIGIVTWVSIGVVVTLTLVLLAVARRARTRLASFPPLAVRAHAGHPASGVLSPLPTETLSAPVPVPPVPVPPVPVPPVPVASVARCCGADRDGEFGVGVPVRRDCASRIDRTVPARGPDRSGGTASAASAAPRLRRSCRLAATTVAEPVPSQPASVWLPPTGSAMTPDDDRELVATGRVAADAGGPPTTAT